MDISTLGVPFYPGATPKDHLMVALGLTRLTDGERRYVLDFNLLGGAILSLSTVVLEVIMLAQNFSRGMQPEVVQAVGWAWIIQHRVAYAVQLASALVLLAGTVRHYFGRPLGTGASWVLLAQYIVIALAFGMFIARWDANRGHGVYALLTQMVALACIFSIRPSIFVPGCLLAVLVTTHHANELGLLSHGDRVNLTMLFVIIVVSCCMKYYSTVRIARDRLLLQEQTHSDGLTGLGNVHALRQDMPRLVGGRISASVLDVDGFKLCNDRLGHAVGNTILALLADALLESFGPQGTCYRTGGDEFVVISVDLPEREQRALVDDALARFHSNASARGIQIDGRPITVSAGTAHGSVGKASDVDDLLQLADQSMYRMKERRRELLAGAGHQEVGGGTS